MRIERMTFKPFNLAGMETPEAAPVEVAPVVEVVPEPVPENPYKFTEADLAHARKQGYDEGFITGKETGLLQARNEADDINQQLTQITRQIAQRLSELHGDYRTYLETQSEEVTKLSIAAARKVAGAALAENPLADVEAMVRDCLLALVDVPSVTITTHPSLAKELEKRLQNTLSSNQDFNAQVTVTGDPAIILEECKIEWRNGGAERQIEAMWKRVEGIMKQYRPMSVTPFKTTAESVEAGKETTKEDANITVLHNTQN